MSSHFKQIKAPLIIASKYVNNNYLLLFVTLQENIEKILEYISYIMILPHYMVG